MLKGGVAGAISAVLPAACGERPLPVNTVHAHAPASAIAVGSLVIVGRSVLGRDAGGLYAMSAACTHQGCLVSVVGGPPQSLSCSCHGSTFSNTGAVTRGPARAPLQHFQVQVDASGSVTVSDGVPVASNARTPV